MINNTNYKACSGQFSLLDAICDICGEKLEYKKYFAQEHLKKFPDHKKYTIE